MNDRILNRYVSDKPYSANPSKAASGTHAFVKQLSMLEKSNKINALYSKLKKAYDLLCSLYAAENRFDETLNSWLNVANNILFYNLIVLRAYNKKLYSMLGTHCKNDITSLILNNFDQDIANAFDKLFDCLYRYIDSFESLKDSTMYSWILRDIEPNTYNQLYVTTIPIKIQSYSSPQGTIIHSVVHPASYLPNDNTKPCAILSVSNNITYGVINRKAIICYNNDIYELNADTINKLFFIKAKHNEILKKYVQCLKKELELTCLSLNIKDFEKTRPYFKYLYYNNSGYCFKPCQGKINFVSLATSALFKPIIIDKISIKTLKNSYIPQALCKPLQVISNNNYSVINTMAKLFADCLLPYPQSHKLYIIKTRNEHDTEIIKCFINRILSYGNGPHDSVCVIDKNQSINDVCRKYKQLDELKYTRIYAMFMKRGKKPLDTQLSIYLSNLLKNTSNNSKNTIVNNIQPILFQTNDDISDLPPELVEFIDLSDSQLDDRICMLSVEDCCWTRLYLSLYGLHLILEKQKSVHNFNLGCQLTPISRYDDPTSTRKNIIENIKNRFISEYFLSKQENEKRKSERAKRILELKKEHGKSESARSIIILELSKTPLYTTRDELERYIEEYLETQYKPTFLSANNISRKDILKSVQSEYAYTKTNIEYTMSKKYRVFKDLSLKEPWLKTEAKMEQTNINTSENSDIKPQEIPKPASFDDPIDENLLEFLSALNNAVKF